jgi:large subunit ribosomal protein L13
VIMMIVNAEKMVAGRLSSKVAKALINGETITIVNAENVVLVGRKEDLLRKFVARVDAAVKSNPHYGPKYDRIPSKMLRKMVKGMLPNKSRTNERLISNLTVYNSIPKEFKEQEFANIEGVMFNERNDSLTLGEIAKLLGGKW